MEPIEVGVIARAHGVRGELRVHLHNPDSEALANAETLWVGEASFVLESVRATNQAFLIRLAGIDDRTAAERLKGNVVRVDRADLGLADDDVLLVDLIGLRAVHVDGSEWGEIVAIENGAQDRLVIAREGKSYQLPLVDAFVVSVDLEAKTVVVDPPDDLPEA